MTNILVSFYSFLLISKKYIIFLKKKLLISGPLCDQSLLSFEIRHKVCRLSFPSTSNFMRKLNVSFAYTGTQNISIYSTGKRKKRIKVTKIYLWIPAFVKYFSL